MPVQNLHTSPGSAQDLTATGVGVAAIRSMVDDVASLIVSVQGM